MTDNVLSVKQLNFYVRSLIESDSRLLNITVTGEISNFKNHYASGHWYFTLKDNDAAIRCVMFRANTLSVKFDVQDGLQVVIRGKVSIYEKDGQYQFYAEQMSVAGLGDITLKYEQIKQKLLEEGLFDKSSKRPIPKFPKKIAVVTSATGAAVQDISNILSRRWPIAEAKLFAVSVQGELAVPQMLEALERIYEMSQFDVIIIGRGGGSIEDLWAFNDERLARKIYESPIPVISAVGHETDFTICDFVADLRAPTPSAAAELAVPDINEITDRLNSFEAHLKNLLFTNYKNLSEKFERISSSSYFTNPLNSLTCDKFQSLDGLYDRLLKLAEICYKTHELKLAKISASLDALSPLKTLARGFASISQNGDRIFSAKDIKKEELIKLNLYDGEVDCEVKSVNLK